MAIPLPGGEAIELMFMDCAEGVMAPKGCLSITLSSYEKIKDTYPIHERSSLSKSPSGFMVEIGYGGAPAAYYRDLGLDLGGSGALHWWEVCCLCIGTII